MVVARRILRRRAAATAKNQGSVACELVDGTLSHTHAQPRVGARSFIVLWTAIILLPEEAQVCASRSAAAETEVAAPHLLGIIRRVSSRA